MKHTQLTVSKCGFKAMFESKAYADEAIKFFNKNYFERDYHELSEAEQKVLTEIHFSGVSYSLDLGGRKVHMKHCDEFEYKTIEFYDFSGEPIKVTEIMEHYSDNSEEFTALFSNEKDFVDFIADGKDESDFLEMLSLVLVEFILLKLRRNVEFFTVSSVKGNLKQKSLVKNLEPVYSDIMGELLSIAADTETAMKRVNDECSVIVSAFDFENRCEGGDAAFVDDLMCAFIGSQSPSRLDTDYELLNGLDDEKTPTVN